MNTPHTDRELLELAAKAAGLRVKIWDGHTGPMCAIDDDRHGCMWMPLADDGDALRLAAKLRIDIEWDEQPAGRTVEAYQRGEESCFCATEAEADYRRAIVRAAAQAAKEGAQP